MTEINVTNFLRRFAGFDSLMKFDEMKSLSEESGIHIPKSIDGTPGEETIDGYSLEHSVV